MASRLMALRFETVLCFWGEWVRRWHVVWQRCGNIDWSLSISCVEVDFRGFRDQKLSGGESEFYFAGLNVANGDKVKRQFFQGGALVYSYGKEVYIAPPFLQTSQWLLPAIRIPQNLILLRLNSLPTQLAITGNTRRKILPAAILLLRATL